MILRTKNRPAFTLIELLLVIGIIGVLASVVIQALSPRDIFRSARDAERRADLNAILKAVEQVKIKKWRLPVDSNGFATIGSELEICRFDNSDFRVGGCRGLQFASLQELVSDYIYEIPVDPEYDETVGDSPGDFKAAYRTHYFIRVDDQERVFVRSSDFNNGEGLTLPST